MAVFSRAIRRRCFRWHNAISCTDMTTDTTTHHGVPPRAVVHRRAGEWPEELAAGSLTLEFDDRHRRRTRLVTDQGDDVLLDLPSAIAMGDRDGLQLDDGRWLVVRAAAEPVVHITQPDPGRLVRLAWQLGDRHVPAEIDSRDLRIRPDHVIEDMLRGFGATLVKLEAAFHPEGGAYRSHRHGAKGEASDHYEEP